MTLPWAASYPPVTGCRSRSPRLPPGLAPSKIGAVSEFGVGGDARADEGEIGAEGGGEGAIRRWPVADHRARRGGCRGAGRAVRRSPSPSEDAACRRRSGQHRLRWQWRRRSPRRPGSGHRESDRWRPRWWRSAGRRARTAADARCSPSKSNVRWNPTTTASAGPSATTMARRRSTASTIPSPPATSTRSPCSMSVAAARADVTTSPRRLDPDLAECHHVIGEAGPQLSVTNSTVARSAVARRSPPPSRRSDGGPATRLRRGRTAPPDSAAVRSIGRTPSRAGWSPSRCGPALSVRQHGDDDQSAVALGRGEQARACTGRVSGLDPVGARVHLQPVVGRREHLVVERGVVAGDGGAERRIVHQRGAEGDEVVCRGILAVAVEAGGVGRPGRRTQRPCGVRHPFGEGVLATGDVDGQCSRRVVGADDQQRSDQHVAGNSSPGRCRSPTRRRSGATCRGR